MLCVFFLGMSCTAVTLLLRTLLCFTGYLSVFAASVEVPVDLQPDVIWEASTPPADVSPAGSISCSSVSAQFPFVVPQPASPSNGLFCS